MSVFTMCKHRRLNCAVAQFRWVGKKMSGPCHGPGKHLSSYTPVCMCVYSFYILISICVFLCVPQTNTQTHTQCSPKHNYFIYLFIRVTYILPGGLSLVDQRMHRKNRKEKKLPISVFPTSVECHRQVFFHITTLKIRKHTKYVASGYEECVCV